MNDLIQNLIPTAAQLPKTPNLGEFRSNRFELQELTANDRLRDRKPNTLEQRGTRNEKKKVQEKLRRK